VDLHKRINTRTIKFQEEAEEEEALLTTDIALEAMEATIM
jgi:hypothetical protein